MNQFKKVSLGLYPTPLYKLENLSRELGTNVWIKRDDLCGVALEDCLHRNGSEGKTRSLV